MFAEPFTTIFLSAVTLNRMHPSFWLCCLKLSDDVLFVCAHRCACRSLAGGRFKEIRANVFAQNPALEAVYVTGSSCTLEALSQMCVQRACWHLADRDPPVTFCSEP